MKKLWLYTFLLAAVAFAGCKKFLDKEPDNRTVIKTPEQISQLLTSAYPHGNYIMFCEAMSDNAEDKGKISTGYDFVDRVNSQAYRFQVVESSPEDLDTPEFYWYACYKAIASANQALELIDNSPDKARLMAQKGEALLARAYAHWMLVTLFSKAYDPATASADPGIPYVTEPEKSVTKQYERKTVAYVYDMIEKDLMAGYPLINDEIYGKAPKFHFNRRAASAFAVRFYMFKRNYNNVISYAGKALPGNAVDNIRPWNTMLADMQYLELQAEYTKSSLPGNFLLQEANSVWGRSYYALRFGFGERISSKLIINENVTGWTYAYPMYGSSPESYNIPKFYEHFVTEGINDNFGNPYNTIPLFTGEEALLNRAEAYLRLNNRDAALADINAFVSKNIKDYYAATDNVTAKKAVDFYNMPGDTTSALINAVLDFKRAFSLHEGMRWFDILRLKLPVRHALVDGSVININGDDKRKILQIPITAQQAGLPANER